MSGKVIEILNQSEKTLISFELLPPLKGDDIDSIYQTLDPLMEFNPPYLNITYHQEEVVYKKINHNMVERRVIWKRPGTVAISAALKYRYKVIVVPHMICGGFTREETENALIDLNFLDVNNLLAVRGDPNSESKIFTPEEGGHVHSIDLLKQIVDMNRGIYLDEDLQHPSPTDFSVGVAGYPEKHPEAPNMESDLHFLKKKIDAGADFVVTQMFFDNTKYFTFVDSCRKKGIEVPIIPGIKPVSLYDHLSYLPKTFNINLPEALVKEVLKCKTQEAIKEVGVEWAIEQSKELVAAGVPVVHYFTMGRSDNIFKIAKAVF